MRRVRSMLVLCPFPIGVAAAQRLKFEQYYDQWRAQGWQVDVAPYMDRRLWTVLFEPGHLLAKAAGVVRGTARRIRDLARVDRYDMVYCHMYVTPVGTSAAERVVRGRAKRLILDIEDNILVGQRIEKNDNPNRLGQLFRNRAKTAYLIRHADHVITSSPALAEQCRALNTKGAATYISSSVDTERFVPANRYDSDHVPVIGWTGTFSTKPYLELLTGVFRRLSQERRFTLRVIGNFDLQMPGVDLEVLRWGAAEEVEQLQGIDIGVYPLPRDEWVSGKSGLKAIQYMAFGLPCVASRAGHTPNIVKHEHNGLLVDSDDDWLVALRRLIDEPDLRRRLGEQARRDAVERYSLQAVGRDYTKVIEAVVGEG